MVIIKLHNKKCTQAEVITYPDGQHNIKLDMSYYTLVKDPVTINCTVKSFEELEILICLVQALRKEDFYIERINFIYLFGMRCDRAFEPGMPNYFRDIVAPIINSFNISHVTVLHPHSLLALSALNNARPSTPRIHTDDYVVIGGDSNSRVNPFDPPWGIHFEKERTGRDLKLALSKDSITLVNSTPSHKPILVYDDLCDGGLTFTKAAEKLKQEFPKRAKYLYVTHGIFSKGVEMLTNVFDGVICTNSYQDIKHPKVKQIEVI